MAGHKGSKYYDVFLRYKIWLEGPEHKGILGDGRLALIKNIDKTGSLKAAADEMSLSYRQAWGNIRSAEEALGFSLIEKHRGGSHGGNSVLTEEGRILISAYDEFLGEIRDAVGISTKRFFHKINMNKSEDENLE